MNNKRLFKEVKDLHLGERLLFQTPAEEFDVHVYVRMF